MTLERVIGDLKRYPPIWFDGILISPSKKPNSPDQKNEDYIWMRKIRTAVHKEQLCIIYARKGQIQHFHYNTSEANKANKKYNECFLILRAENWIRSNTG